MCGENRGKSHVKAFPEGSPPRVRGQQFGETENYDKVRITPACAGKTNALFCHFDVERDHPRVCGENQSGSGKYR